MGNWCVSSVMLYSIEWSNFLPSVRDVYTERARADLTGKCTD